MLKWFDLMIIFQELLSEYRRFLKYDNPYTLDTAVPVEWSLLRVDADLRLLVYSRHAEQVFAPKLVRKKEIKIKSFAFICYSLWLREKESRLIIICLTTQNEVFQHDVNICETLLKMSSKDHSKCGGELFWQIR